LADKSALARLHSDPVRAVIGPLLLAGEVATCAIVDVEVLFSARSPVEYSAVRRRRGSYPNLPITDQVCVRALELQSALAVKSQHRGVSIPDLIIAACAQIHDVTVLHYDSDFDLIASVDGPATQWVVPRGTVT
jgi:predicted nucleic acid-binding protein